MNIISKILRFVFKNFFRLLQILRVLKLKLLYPGIVIDFKTKIESRCNIVCIKGGQLKIINSKISFGTQIITDSTGHLTIDNSFIGRNCVITSKEKITINKNCLVAEMVVIRDQDHIIHTNSTLHDQKFSTAPVIIEENVWIASKATIVKGVTIGKHAVVAASAVVTKNIPSGELWGGIPAKFIKDGI